MAKATAPFVVVLRPEDHVILGEAQFGMPGLTAIESIGPFATIRVSGPLVTVHDSVVEARKGIGHHPHRMNERLFYIEDGELDHDDSLNGITGHVGAGDVAQFTEGQRGMLHSEWNHGDVDTRAYILVYSSDPVPEQAAFHVLKDGDAPRYEEGEGVATKELVGPRSPLVVTGDLRLFTDSRLEPGAVLTIRAKEGEGGLLSVREGGVELDGAEGELPSGTTVVVPPGDDVRTVQVRAVQPSRVIRVVHGPGHGFIVARAG